MPRDSLWAHASAPLCVCIVAAILLGSSNADLAIARHFFDSARGEWLGAHSWWVNDFVHTGGRWAIRVAVLLAIALALAARGHRRLRPLQRPATYFAVSVVASVGVVGLLKALTNVDCPWDLAAFGGDLPYVHLFADRPAQLPRGRCFPAAHASSGYALVALYFALRERSRVLARSGLALGIVAGLVFGFSQQSRGAHFFSHDLWSACITWMVALSVYAFGFRASLWSGSREDTLGTCRLGAGGHAPVPGRAG